MKRVLIATIAFVALILTGCAAKNPTTVGQTTQTTQVRFLKALDVLATASNALVDPVTNLAAAGVLTTDQANQILVIDGQIATTTKTVAALVNAPGTWASKLPQITALVAGIPQISVLTQKYAGMNSIQFQALVTALQGLESAAQLVAIEIQN